MSWAVLVAGLRWTFWVLAWFGTLLAGLLTIAATPVPRWGAWVMTGALVAGIALDVRRVLREGLTRTT